MLLDEICDSFSEKNVQLTVRTLEPDDRMVLIEGKPIALRMLAFLLLAMAEQVPCEGFFIGPESAGSAFFTAQATHGIYIHVL